MEQTLSEIISQALSKAREQHNSRENALVVTKLQEALMWHNEHQRLMQDIARRTVTVNNNVGSPQTNGEAHG